MSDQQTLIFQAAMNNEAQSFCFEMKIFQPQRPGSCEVPMPASRDFIPTTSIGSPQSSFVRSIQENSEQVGLKEV